MNKEQVQMEWDIKVPIFKNKLILRQLGLAFGIPFGTILLVFSGFAVFMQDQNAWYAFALVLVLLSLTFVFVMVFFKGSYDVHFEITDEGIDSYTNEEQANKARMINRLAFLGGLLKGMSGVAGAAMLADRRQKVSIYWDLVSTVKYYPQHYTILIKENAINSMGIFCTPENYEAVEKMIKERV